MTDSPKSKNQKAPSPNPSPEDGGGGLGSLPPQNDLIGAAIDGVIRICLENKLIVFLVMVAIVGWGMMVMPFDYELATIPRDPVPVDAIPDIGENQQIVFTRWMDRSVTV